MDQIALSPAACKKIIARALAERGLSNRLTARTLSFEDLARASIVFVTIEDWGSPDQPITDPLELATLFDAFQALARTNGFRLQTG